jgi:glyoxylase-like metal-dependent hydrolase (beta-lactamase superfamily II)
MMALAPSTHGQQRDWDAVQIEVVRITDNLHMLIGEGGNIGLSTGADGTFLVDDQYAPLTEKIQAAVRTVTPDPVQFLVNTHFHGDHTGGNENFGKAGSIIVAHQNVRARMSVEQLREILGNRIAASPAIALPKITFSDEIDFYWNDEEIHVFHVAHAHTDGDAIIHFKSADVFHMGDTFFNGRFPFIDVDMGGNVNGVIATAEKVLSMADSDTRIIPGHGPLASPDDLRAYRDMLMAVRDKVQTMVNGGASVDEVLGSNPTAEFGSTWSGEPERFVRLVYHSLAK